MTTLIVCLAITNMAIGYALAVCLGHGQVPWQITRGRHRPARETGEQKTVPTVIAEKPAKQDSDQAMLKSAEESGEPSTSDEAETATETAAEENALAEDASTTVESEAETPIVAQVPQLDVSDLMPKRTPVVEEAPTKEVVESASVGEDDEFESLAELLQSTASPTSKPEESETEASKTDAGENAASETKASADSSPLQTIAEPPVAPAPVPTLTTAEKPDVPESPLSGLESSQQPLKEQAAKQENTAADSNEPHEIDDQQIAERRVELEQELLSGIEAFQSQLKQQQQPAEADIEIEYETTKATAEAEASAPEVLAGIEAFRTQLEQMKVAAQPTESVTTS